MTQAQCEALRQYKDSALNLSEVLEITGLTESVLRQFIRVGLLPRRERPSWDLNEHKPFDVADVERMQQALFGFIECSAKHDLQTIAINELNRRVATNKLVVDELFEKIADGTLRGVNGCTPGQLCDLVFDREEVKDIIGNAHDLATVSVEQLSRMTGWKSECIRHWIKAGLLCGESGQLRGRPVHWVSMRAVHQFMRHYKVISELALLLATSPKALTDRLRKLGIPIIGALPVAPGVTRGGLVTLQDVLSTHLY
ncbi:MAG TPA: hypothetical protein DEB15_07450 [Pusillimonas sp.]|nr:hypothetical protein [Pusillimonas sp.]